ncbi:MerR family transcriptional regulator [Lacrimispora sp.]|uniref:MerR family transcriptional regulator n=1 Tax=Lacrimispora sp. TaxID=2719234 RepID=UPI0032E4C7E1
MEQYSIRQTSEQLGISKDTLRYYDKLGLVSPKRGENRYRYYTQKDILDLQYCEVMKYIGFTLAEIKNVFKYIKANCTENPSEMQKILSDKTVNIERKAALFHDILTFMNEVQNLMAQKMGASGETIIDKLIIDLFHNLKENQHEE